MKLICVVFAALVAASVADHVPRSGEYDYYADYKDSDEVNSKELMPGSEELDVKPIEDTKDDTFDALKDYQFEDNRSDAEKAVAPNGGEDKPAESDKEDEKHKDTLGDEEPIPDDAEETLQLKDNGDEGIGEVPVEAEEPQADDAQKSEDNDSSEDLAVDDDYWGDVLESDEEPLAVPSTDDDLKKVLEETREILKQDSQEGLDDAPEANGKSKESQDEIREMIDKIDKLLDEANSNLDDEGKSDEDVFSENNDDSEESADDIYKDLKADLDSLFETFDKLNDEPTEKKDEEINKVDIKDYEDKHGSPYKEASVLAARSDDYESIEDSNLSEIFKEIAEKTDDDDSAKEEIDSVEKLNEPKKSVEDNKEHPILPMSAEQANIEPIVASKHFAEKKTDSEYFDEELYDDDGDGIEDIIKVIFSDEHPYGEDGLVDSDHPKDDAAEEIDVSKKEQVKDDESDNDIVEPNEPSSTKEVSTQKSIMVDELSPAQFDDLMAQFKMVHSEDFDVKSENFDKHIAPIHITLSANESVVITSPNYPNPYPTNNIIDWMFEGEGTGIELNITDFAVNGVMGDYLLVKPGGVDESGQDGLIFSYRLNTERRYRFFDVNRMFVRFEAKLGMMFMRGFKFSVKMIMPPAEQRGESVPEAEAVVVPPRYTLTLNLAGLTVSEFQRNQEDFVALIADMATKYINNNDIYFGYNSTLEVTQITRTAVCSIHWPNYETCVEVTFGVPLNYGDADLEPRLNNEDLADMWSTLITEEQFAVRLEKMGVKEYMVPDDRTVLTAWLVIAAGVVISMAMLAFALWRFSCFEDYTRMKSFSDTDSIRNEKRNLDLYPTPHQTLPPLYAENEYKWADEKYDDATRVDMGGFANKSYVREDMYDFDSDEDVISARDRKAVVSSKDVYAV